MPLPIDVVRLFTNPAATKVIATINAEGTVHAAPFASLTPTPDGSMLVFSQGVAEETPKRLAYMKQVEKMPVVVVQLVDTEKNTREGYSICCKVGDALTSGPIYDKTSERVVKLTGSKPRAVWTLHPVRYKTHTPGPNRGKVVTL
jgi:hypothetical protein